MPLRSCPTDQKGTTNSFALGQFNLFVTSKLSERLSVLAEAVLEADQQNAFGFELERLFFNTTPAIFSM